VPGADNGRIIAVRPGVLLATAFHPELTLDRRIHEFSFQW
jgi:pyridoxal 5'-phosphate synthase pdxT subunit